MTLARLSQSVVLAYGWRRNAIAFAAGLLSTCFYEFCHCVQHLNTAPKTAFMKRLKQLQHESSRLKRYADLSFESTGPNY